MELPNVVFRSSECPNDVPYRLTGNKCTLGSGVFVKNVVTATYVPGRIELVCYINFAELCTKTEWVPLPH